MGAHTAIRASQKLGDRVTALCLLQPAIYAKEAEDLLFRSEFTEVLRRPESWRSSYALADAANFKGIVHVAIGSEDPVIPWGVIEGLASSFKSTASSLRLEVFQGAAHELPEWIPARPFYGEQLVAYLSQNAEKSGSN